MLKVCEFAFTDDDAVNFYGTLIAVVSNVNATTFNALRRKDEPFDDLLDAGDAVRFLAEPSYGLVTTER